jgi:dephospho-CoA kinase
MDTSAGRDFVIALLGNIGVGKNSLLDCYKEGILYSGGK